MAGDPMHTAPTPFGDGPIERLAIYCSDGRFARQCEQFVTDHLQLGRCDRLVVPGGPAALIEPDDAHAAIASARLLIALHAVRRVVLIMHEDCGYYAHQRQLTGDAQRTAQRNGLSDIVRRLHDINADLAIDCYEARLDAAGHDVQFTCVDPG